MRTESSFPNVNNRLKRRNYFFFCRRTEGVLVFFKKNRISNIPDRYSVKIDARKEGHLSHF